MILSRLKIKPFPNEGPGSLFIVAMAAFTHVQFATFRNTSDFIDMFELTEGFVDMFYGKDFIMFSGDGAEGTRSYETCNIVHFAESQDPGDVIAVAVEDRPNTPHKCTEAAAGNSDCDPFITGRGEQRGCSASGVSGDGNTRRIYIGTFCSPINQS